MLRIFLIPIALSLLTSPAAVADDAHNSTQGQGLSGLQILGISGAAAVVGAAVCYGASCTAKNKVAPLEPVVVQELTECKCEARQNNYVLETKTPDLETLRGALTFSEQEREALKRFWKYVTGMFHYRGSSHTLQFAERLQNELTLRSPDAALALTNHQLSIVNSTFTSLLTVVISQLNDPNRALEELNRTLHLDRIRLSGVSADTFRIAALRVALEAIVYPPAEGRQWSLVRDAGEAENLREMAHRFGVGDGYQAFGRLMHAIAQVMLTSGS
jgi:hypothetical protein